mmetsp:Transcript_9499/g.17623  ORF Transcript_9499/g.17623 Transcript_9499/m.17623 type:complete len:103 (+) Transcript_9499:79-387(+)
MVLDGTISVERTGSDLAWVIVSRPGPGSFSTWKLALACPQVLDIIAASLEQDFDIVDGPVGVLKLISIGRVLDEGHTGIVATWKHGPGPVTTEIQVDHQRLL